MSSVSENHVAHRGRKGEDQQDRVETLNLHIGASKLRRCGGLKRPLPDTYAVISILKGIRSSIGENEGSNSSLNDSFTAQNSNNNFDDNDSAHSSSGTPLPTMRTVEQGKTEIVYQTRYPQYTSPIPIKYISGSKSFIKVEIFQQTSRTNDYEGLSMGYTHFEIGDILSDRHRTKARRLPDGSIVRCRFDTAGGGHQTETVSAGSSPSSPSRSVARSSGGQYVTQKVSFQFRLNDLNFGGGNALASSVLDGRTPEHILQIERWDTTDSRMRWLTVYRSNPVCTSDSTTIMWDESEVAFDFLCDGRLGCPLKISVWQYRNWGRHSVATCETNLKVLLDAHRKKIDRQKHCEQSWFPQTTSQHSMLPLYRSGKRLQQVGRLQIISAEILGCQSDDCQGSYIYDNSTIDDEALQDLVQDSTGDEGGMGQDQDRADVADVPPQTRVVPPAFTFHDYMNNNFCVLDLFMAIDFTSSNGDANQPGTLHDRCSTSFNVYEETIISFGNALAPYSDGVSLRGFGAKFNDTIQHIFRCGPDDKIPKSHGVHGILRAYKSVFDSGLTMSGPTVFDDVILAAGARARKHQIASSQTLQQQEQGSTTTTTPPPHQYCVLLVITDGLAKVLEETRRQLQVYSSVPLSVVFVGVGPVDFTGLRNLCNEIRLNNSRPNISFVEFQKHHRHHDPSSLSREVMQELPNQLVQYMLMNGIHPPE